MIFMSKYKFKPYSQDRIIYCKDTGENVAGNKYLQSKHWAMLRERIFNDRNCECERCHQPLSFDKAVIHHNTYKRFGNENLSDLNLVCDKCHKIIHAHKKAGHEENKNIMSLYQQLSKEERKEVLDIMKSMIDKRNC